MIIPDEIARLKTELESGQKVKESVRTILGWFGFWRRGILVSESIRTCLWEQELVTVPDFDTGWLDDHVEFRLKDSAEQGVQVTDPVCEAETRRFVPEIGMLDSATCSLKTVCRDDRLETAVSLMLMNDFSQLPVMQGGRSVDGYISWRTIGSYYARNSKQPEYVRNCLESFVETVDTNMALFEATKKVLDNEFVLVKGLDQSISGIVTTSDIGEQFRELSEAFLLVGEIENTIRALLSGKFKRSEILAVIERGEDDRDFTSLTELGFGDYVRIVEYPSYWEKINLALDRSLFSERLDKVRKIRNEIMHFRPEGVSPEDVNLLDETARFLNTLNPSKG